MNEENLAGVGIPSKITGRYDSNTLVYDLFLMNLSYEGWSWAGEIEKRFRDADQWLRLTEYQPIIKNVLENE